MTGLPLFSLSTPNRHGRGAKTDRPQLRQLWHRDRVHLVDARIPERSSPAGSTRRNLGDITPGRTLTPARQVCLTRCESQLKLRSELCIPQYDRCPIRATFVWSRIRNFPEAKCSTCPIESNASTGRAPSDN